MFYYWFLKYLLSPIVRVLWVGKVEGKHYLPKKGAAVLVSNHQSYLDPPLLMAISRRRIFFAVGDFVYRAKAGAWLMEKTGQIRVDRKKPGQNNHVYDEAKKILDRGHLLSMFPEGWMSKDGKLQKAYKGAAKIALNSKVDLIPIAICGSFDIYPAHKQIPVFSKKCKIIILEPIKYAELKNHTPAEIVHDMVMPKIAEGLGQEYEHRHLAEEGNATN
jgi:1-acyl-sn-glycerol-3-phosphate acyltransferase